MKKFNKDTVWLLDGGHGSVINGVPQTAGKRSPDWECGVLYEGLSNRDIVKRIAAALHRLKIPYHIVTPELKDVTLGERVRRANSLWLKYDKNAAFISVHSDAFSKESANGWSAFTSVGQTSSDQIAEVMYKYAKKLFPAEKMRTDNTDGDADKEAHFYVLKHTYCPAVLTENFFMTNKKNYLLLNNEKSRQLMAQVHVKAIQELIK